MTSLALPADHTLAPESERRLGLLVDAWQLLADLSFSDLILWVPEVDDNIFWAVAQVRPATGPTALTEDVVGECLAYDAEALVTEAYLSGEICSTSDNKLHAGIPVDVHAIPIMVRGRCVAVVEQHTNRLGIRAPGSLEDAYLAAADILTDMLWRDEFPVLPEDGDPAVSPQVGDGMVRLDPRGVVIYASPNALTAYRRMGLVGELVGEHLLDLTQRLMPREPVHERVTSSLASPRTFDIEGERASLRIRILPLTRAGQAEGALLLCRDTTELRRRERQLVTKDATIREIHHRVKNNLQTVSALLRLQSRRIESEEGREMLAEAMNRVSAIAVVHEILSQSYEDAVHFDVVCDRLMQTVGSVAAAEAQVRTERMGSFGIIPGDAATTLALVINELCQNAVEHGVGRGRGTVTVSVRRPQGRLELQVRDDGAGLPEGFELSGLTRSLGLSIVQTLVADLGGSFSLGPRLDGPGTVATVVVPLREEEVGRESPW